MLSSSWLPCNSTLTSILSKGQLRVALQLHPYFSSTQKGIGHDAESGQLLFRVKLEATQLAVAALALVSTGGKCLSQKQLEGELEGDHATQAASGGW